VFALLVQKKLQDLEVARELQEWRSKVSDLHVQAGREWVQGYQSSRGNSLLFQGVACREEVEEHEKNCQLLSSALSDKNAQLQLQEARTEVSIVVSS